MSLLHVRVPFARPKLIIDIALLFCVAAAIYLVIGIAASFIGPYRPQAEIDLGFGSLVKYSLYSLTRVFAAYLLSLLVTFAYGYAAARLKWAEAAMLSLLDIVQSVPVLGFMPGLVLALIGLFQGSNLGLEIAAVVMIFTGQAWNMVFSFYSSVKTVPTELNDLGTMFGFNRLERLRKIEIPYAVNGLLWNSMLSMAGGWFFLMVIESFRLGSRSFRLKGIGSYMAVAYEQGNYTAVAGGIAAMFVLIILVDRCVWAPLVVWSDRFKFDIARTGDAPRSVVLEWIQGSKLVSSVGRFLKSQRASDSDWYQRLVQASPIRQHRIRAWLRILGRVCQVVVAVIACAAIAYGSTRMYTLVGKTTSGEWYRLFGDTAVTGARVCFAVVVGSLWTIPVGVFIGTNPVWTRRLQPVVQVVASFPAPMLFPLLVFVLIKLGVSFEIGAAVLMLFASQWYILFNVVSGAYLIPRYTFEVSELFRLSRRDYWRLVILPAIFPSLVNGWITSAGGAWNACIVAEIVSFGTDTVQAKGIGATITLAAQAGNYPLLAGGVLTLVVTVVLLDRFFWGALYRMAETRFRFEIEGC